MGFLGEGADRLLDCNWHELKGQQNEQRENGDSKGGEGQRAFISRGSTKRPYVRE